MPTMDMKKRLSLELRGRSPEQIKELVLDDCCAPGGEIDGLSDDFKSLTSLQLSGAGLTSLANLPRLPALRRKKLPQLRSLDLINCEVTSTPGYRSAVFDQLPQLLYLDGFDQENEDAPESEDDDLSEDDGGEEEAQADSGSKGEKRKRKDEDEEGKDDE
uniref:Acidic leucine-rich nuclear phosphoprotein 32 family member n=1 Tax=Eptatretus burgeri TaxID=7764 RepID=A0A8C4QS85_EPTBU